MSEPSVRKRRVFYLMGFDPHDVKRYYMMLKWDARARAARGDCSIDIGRLRPAWEFGDACPCRFQMGGDEVETDYEFLSMTDVFREYRRAGMAGRIFKGVYAALHMVFSDPRLRILRATPWFALFSMYPIVVLLSTLLLSVSVGMLASEYLEGLPGAQAVQFALCLAPFLAFLHLSRHLEERIMLHHMLMLLTFTDDAIHGRQPRLEGRLVRFADRIEEVLREGDADEVLVVGHSLGGMLASAVVAEVLRRLPDGAGGRLSLLTLGSQNNVALLSGARRFRTDMTELAANPHLVWVDVFAPQDIINAGRFDPVERLGLTPSRRHGPHLASARFREAMTPERYRKLRYDFYELHMQFMKGSETGRGFDYFDLIGGRRRLAEYFGLPPRERADR